MKTIITIITGIAMSAAVLNGCHGCRKQPTEKLEDKLVRLSFDAGAMAMALAIQEDPLIITNRGAVVLEFARSWWRSNNTNDPYPLPRLNK